MNVRPLPPPCPLPLPLPRPPPRPRPRPRPRTRPRLLLRPPPRRTRNDEVPRACGRARRRANGGCPHPRSRRSEGRAARREEGGRAAQGAEARGDEGRGPDPEAPGDVPHAAREPQRRRPRPPGAAPAQDLPRRGEGPLLGAMARPPPKALRIGVIQKGRIVEERLLRS